MNIEHAKQIHIAKLVEHLGGRYSHTDRRGDLWYFSPFRPEERTASFKINEEKNSWHDFGLSQTFAHSKQNSGGDILDLWCDYNFKDRRIGIPEALQALSGLASGSEQEQRFSKSFQNIKPAVKKEPRYKIIKISERITFFGLKDELHRRRISIKLAEIYLKQGHILDVDTGKKYYGFLFENDKGGFEASIPNPRQGSCYKTCIGPKSSTRILTSSEATKAADVFEGFWDFLSWLGMDERLLPLHHSYILNSVSLTGEVCEKIMAFAGQVKDVFLFMDNDEAGYQATHAIADKLHENFIVAGREQLYSENKDLSEFWMKRKHKSHP